MRIVRDRTERRPAPETRADEVRAIIDEVRRDGDAAVIRLTERFDAEIGQGTLRVDPDEVRASVDVVEPEVLAGLRAAIENVRRVAEAQLREPTAVELPDGQRVEVAEVPVRRAGIYVPGGRAPYPSTVVMGAVTAHVAGVPQVAVCAPPGHDGHLRPVTLAACALCDVVTEVYRMGGAQAIAAFAYGTDSVTPMDVIVGPGNAWVTEAKRQVFGEVGIDGLAGPSELAVLASPGADPELIALDLLAQAEHGDDSPLWLVSTDAGLGEEVVAAVERLAPERPSATDAELMVVPAHDLQQALRFLDMIAPEHLQLVGHNAEGLAGSVMRAGCIFVGAGAATAFGDYVAGSNHVLPTGGAARFASGLGVATFRRRVAHVSLPGEAPARLAPAGAALARAEGFPVHAESMERRA